MNDYVHGVGMINYNEFVAPNGFTYRKYYDGSKEPYKAMQDKLYFCPLFDEHVFICKGERSDGATGAFDIISFAWWAHDKLCKTGKWKSGKKISNLVCSTVLSYILFKEGRYFRSIYWFFMTFLLGGGEARKNGMLWVRRK